MNTHFTPGLAMRRAIGLKDSCKNCKFRNQSWFPGHPEAPFCTHHQNDPAPTNEWLYLQGCDLHEPMEKS